MKKLSNLNVDRKDYFGNFLLDLNPNLYISFLQNVETSPAPLNTPLLLASEYLSQVAVVLLLLLLLKAYYS